MPTDFEDAAKRELTAEVIRNFGGARLQVTGTSMMPSVWPGDVITVCAKCFEELVIGHIVLCYRNQAFVAHRLVGKRGYTLITRGDSLSYDDPPFLQIEALGEVVFLLRDGTPVSLSLAWWHSFGCLIVRHSEVCTRILLRVQRSCRSSKLSWIH